MKKGTIHGIEIRHFKPAVERMIRGGASGRAFLMRASAAAWQARRHALREILRSMPSDFSGGKSAR
ncbi:hypothetical protein NDK50_22725 [Paraburkholderia bryophila]|uniref:hypothetical protein n=1 Tax=Paraburkholderia bryophila TaxID=420952 RepID=UPI00234B3E7F|nr:hypothetical protein [Paraburkholderia bryophila]WCM23670.1 hypothetical protein NDK50_22725 [Paraburkholderia bryophila]